jgi:hypothetical protein
MKRNKKKEAAEGEKTSAPPLDVPAKVIRKDSGKVVKQYPARIGYHGSGDETDLNPEE